MDVFFVIVFSTLKKNIKFLLGPTPEHQGSFFRLRKKSSASSIIINVAFFFICLKMPRIVLLQTIIIKEKGLHANKKHTHA
jgi:hypothetical protein